MRIISQNKEVNIPYESVTVMRKGSRIAAQMNGDTGGYFYLGRYSNEEQIFEVLEEIKQKGHFLGTGNNWYQMPEDREKENEENKKIQEVRTDHH